LRHELTSLSTTTTLHRARQRAWTWFAGLKVALLFARGRRWLMRYDKNSVRNGMFVMGTQGERIGKVIRCDNETFVVEKGVFFPKDYELRYDHITDMTGGTIRYALTDFLRGRAAEETAAPAAGEVAAAAAAPIASAASATARRGEKSVDRDEIRIPLMREEIGIEKVARESGHVRIHKTVHTEEKRFSVPVTREEVVIEHLAVPRDSALTGDAEFKEDTVDVPLYEEEVRISKRPILEEEVVVRTVAHSVEREGSAMLRYEEAEVEDTRRSPGLSASGDEDYDPETRH
jgi:uncharacterized protein (TIGR02271 family)